MLVIDKNIAEIGQLKNIKVERPKNAGRVWKGIPHYDFVSTIREGIESRGWEIVGEAYSLSKDKADLAGAFDLRIKGINAPEDQLLSIGFLTSNAMRRSSKLVAGTRVLVCNNGMATGEILMHRKKTFNLELSEEIEYGLDAYAETSVKTIDLVNSMKEREITQRETDDILLRAGREGILPWSRVGQVDSEFRNPTFEDHRGATSFNLLQAATHVMKKTPALQQMPQMLAFKNLLPVANN